MTKRKKMRTHRSKHASHTLRRCDNVARCIAELMESRRLLSASLLGDLNTDTDPSNPFLSTSMGANTYFTAFDGHQYGLWKTDGSADGTQLLGAVSQPTVNAAAMATVGNTVYYLNDGGALVKTDGTPSGTFQLARLPTTGIIDNEFQLNPTAVGKELFFSPAEE